MAARIGQQLGNYRLIELLGQGGFADVYLGEHIHLNTLAAIKVLRTQLTSEDVTNFRIEARTIAHLQHPNIIKVLDFGVETTGTPFLVMDYASNGTLRQRHLRGTMLPSITIISYAKQIASALQYAHNAKLIHRDIKPENMLIGPNNEILLSDFGIALPTASAREQSILEHNAPPDQGNWNPVGTVTYMAPEQIQGKPSPASDQYALAVVVYEWISGMPPFIGNYVEIAVQKMSTSPGSLQAMVPNLSSDVEGVVLNALAIDPQRRFKSVQAFANALEQAYHPAVATVVTTASSSPEITLAGPNGRMQIKGEVISIGRKANNQIVLKDDLKVSSRHAELRLAGKGYCLVDLASTNGTFLNGAKLVPQTLYALQPGDTLLIGDTTFTYETHASEYPLEPVSDGSTERSEEPAKAVPVYHDYVPPLANGAPLANSQNAGKPGQLTPLPPIHEPSPPPQPVYNPMPGIDATPYPPPIYQPGSFNAATPFTPSQPGQQPYAPAPNLAPPGPGAGYGYSPVTPLPSTPTPQVAQPGFQPLGNGPVPQKTRSRANNWLKIALISALIVLVAGSGSIGFIVYRNAQPTPAKTLTIFCTALQGKDMLTAWSQLSPAYQSKLTQPVFASFFNGISACTIGTATQDNNSATATLSLVSPVRSATDSLTLEQNSHGAWTVNGESSLDGLTQTLGSFCGAMQQGNYTNAYNQLSQSLQSQVTQDQFTLFFPKATSCSYSALTMLKGGAQITISQGSSSGATDNNQASLVQNNANWKINDFSNMPTKTLTAFCADLQSNNYQDAYNQTSTAFQGGYPESTFANDFSTFTNCRYNPPTLVNSNLTSDMVFNMQSGSTVPFTSFLVRDSNNARWKIDNLVNFPDQVLTVFCNDLGNQDYQDAYDQLATQTRANVSLQTFTQDYNSVTKCSSTFPEQTGNQATSTITYTLTDGSTAKQGATLTEVGIDNWKILDLKNE